MTSQNNKKVGNKIEVEVANYLFQKNYWVHLLKQGVKGQPFDLIAVKNNVALMGDAKHCSQNRFDFNRIEPNQYTSMELALECGNTNIGFFLVGMHDEIKFIKWTNLKKLVLENKIKSINLSNKYVKNI